MVRSAIRIFLRAGFLLTVGAFVGPAHFAATSPAQVESACAQSTMSLRCYASYSNCWFNCDTFWRCQPDGECTSVSGKNPYDSGTCGADGGNDEEEVVKP